MASLSDEQFSYIYKNIKLEGRENEPLGFTVASGDGGSTYNIVGINKQGVADRDGRLELGDRIVTLNNQPIDNLPFPIVRSLFRNLGDGCHLTIEREVEETTNKDPQRRLKVFGALAAVAIGVGVLGYSLWKN